MGQCVYEGVPRTEPPILDSLISPAQSSKVKVTVSPKIWDTSIMGLVSYVI